MNYRLFEPLVMFFGMTNNLAIFQTIIFWDLIVENIIIVYLNNILIFNQTLKEHHKAVCRVLGVLAKYKLAMTQNQVQKQ